jgi:formate/nitrite transporter FocA (FNT family)
MATNILGGEKTYTVAALTAIPTANLKLGDRAFVIDATAPTFAGALVGGGAVVAPAYWNGVAWVTG